MWPWILKVTGHKKIQCIRDLGMVHLVVQFQGREFGFYLCVENLMCIIMMCVRIEISCLATDFKSQHLGFHQPF
jgi:hypothetical protein